MNQQPQREVSAHVFQTRIGAIGLAWNDAGVVRLRLPERDPATLEAAMARRGRLVPARDLPVAISGLVSLLCDYAEGVEVDLRPVVVDLADTSPAMRQVYGAARRIGWGETATYGGLAAELGNPRLARLVGQAMAKNPVPIIIPCHRVLASGGRIGGFSAPGGTVAKSRLLALEGRADVSTAPLLDRLACRAG